MMAGSMLITLAEAARRIGVSEKHARKLLKDLPMVQVGKRRRYSASAVNHYIDQLEQQANPQRLHA